MPQVVSYRPAYSDPTLACKAYHLPLPASRFQKDSTRSTVLNAIVKQDGSQVLQRSPASHPAFALAHAEYSTVHSVYFNVSLSHCRTTCSAIGASSTNPFTPAIHLRMWHFHGTVASTAGFNRPILEIQTSTLWNT